MAIPTTIESLSTTAASNGPSGSEQRTLADDGLRQAYAFIAQMVNAGTDIASASTITPPSTGSSFHITGTTSITTIASTNSWNGRTIVLIFDGILTFTHSSNLALPGSANITTAANDVAIMRQNASGAWRCIHYQPAASLPITSYLPLAGGTLTGGLSGTTGSFSSTITATALIPSGSSVPANGTYLPAANTVGIASNTTLRWSVNSAGNHVFVAPSSGTGVVVNGGNLTDGFTYTGTALGIPLTLRDLAAAPNNATQAFIGLSTAALTGTNGDIVLVPRTSTNAAVRLFTGNAGLSVERYNVNGTGNHTFAAPSSGSTLAISHVASTAGITLTDGTRSSFWYEGAKVLFGASSNHDLSFYTNNTEQLSITADGRLYGTALHNNAGAVTGTTNQYIASGTYTPTLANGSNVAASTMRVGQWMRVGNVATVSGDIDIDPTATGNTSFTLTLPIASAFTLREQCGGTFSDVSGNGNFGSVEADTTNDVAAFLYNATSAANLRLSYHYTYLIV